MAKEWVRERVWYHRIPLPNGPVTPGWAPMEAAAYQLPERFDGLRILDVGAWDGYWTFEALRRGAAEVVAIDNLSDPLNDLALGGHGDRGAPRDWSTFDRCRDEFGYGWERCKRYRMDALDVNPEVPGGQFDIVFLFGVLYHCRHPLLLLDRLRRVCCGEIYVESAICDDYSPYRETGGLGDVTAMEFYPGAELGNMPTNWWAPTLRCLAQMVRAAGWPEINAWKLTDEPKNPSQARGFVKGSA